MTPLAFPTPEPRRRTKALQTRAKGASRRQCVLDVWARAHGRCESCGRLLRPARDPEATLWTIGHVHESTPRSLGGDPTNPATCRLLCPECHAQAHRLRISGQLRPSGGILR